ncbi:hypothetical protein [Streptomyces sp. NPDC005303]|uniref:hypothetical protein n=1 Tax=Streptomyces sp. NPDC005303 TaxID=3155713 RepID=UPI0033A161C2
MPWTVLPVTAAPRHPATSHSQVPGVPGKATPKDFYRVVDVHVCSRTARVMVATQPQKPAPVLAGC